MRRGTKVAIALTFLLLAGVIAAASRLAERDRRELLVTFNGDRRISLGAAIRQIQVQLADVEQNLEFARKLVETSTSDDDRQREMEALLAVVREYRMVELLDAEGRPRITVVDPFAPKGWSAEPFRRCMADAARAATARQEKASWSPLTENGIDAYRAFAIPLSGRAGGALVILVDIESAFGDLRLMSTDPWANLILIGPDDRFVSPTRPELASVAAAPRPPATLAQLLDAMKAHREGTLVLPRRDLTGLNLPRADAVAVFASIPARSAGTWALAVISSSEMLQSQERSVLLRIALLAGGVVAVILGLSVYSVRAARRVYAVQERLRSAEQVAHLREKAERILEKLPVEVIALDGEDRITSINRPPDRAPHPLGAPLEAAFPGAPRAALEELRRLVVAARRSMTVESLVAEPLPLLGGETYFAVHAVPLQHPLPDVTLLVVVENVTELRALSSQLLRAEKLATVGVLAAGIAHEIGTPLGVVRGRAEMLASRLGPASPHGKNAGTIVEEIDGISRVIQELLDFSRSFRPSREAVGIEESVAKVADLLALEARARKVSVTTEVAPRLPPIAANADQLRQVLVNLTLNALHACAPGGHVRLRATAGDGRHATIEIIDDGSGIPDDLRHRVFDPFFTTKKRGKGTGLGLTVAVHIARNHGGDIELESAAGRGTRVIVRWPLADTGAEERDDEASARTRARGG